MELLNRYIDYIGNLSTPVFSVILGILAVGYFFDIQKSTLWRNVVGYFGNVNVETKSAGTTEDKKTVRA